MKTIKLFIIVLPMLAYPSVFGQFIFVDPALDVLKTTVTASLATENEFKKEQIRLLKDLEALEKEYADKRRPKANFKDLPIVAAAVGGVEFTNRKIEELKTKINLIKINPLHLKHGLSRYESDLIKEERYLDEVRSDYDIFILGIGASGGAGYNYTACLKVLLRVMDVRANVLKLENNVNNLITLNKEFIK